jgi:hypothetical protein
MASRRFLSWPAGWRKSLPSGMFVGVIVSASLIVAQGLSSGWNQIDWCGSAIIFFFVVVGITALVARVWPDPCRDDKPKRNGSGGSH